MQQISSHHAIGVHHQVVERLLSSGCAGDGCNAISLISDGDQPGVALHFLLQTNMRLIAIEIQPDGSGAQCIQPLQGLAKQGVLQRPAVALQVAFADSHDRDRPCQLVLCVGLVLAAAQLQSQVIDEQVGVFHQRGVLQSHQQARGKGIGDQPPQGLPPAHALGSERLNSFCMRAMSALRRESSRFS